MPAESTTIPCGVSPVVPRIDEAASAEAANVAAQSSAAPVAATAPATLLRELPVTKLVIRFPQVRNRIDLSSIKEPTRVAAQADYCKHLRFQHTKQ